MRDFINLVEAMTRDQATNTLRRYGVDPTGLSFPALKKEYTDLVRKHHSDAGGSDNDMAVINSAFDFFKELEKHNKNKGSTSGTSSSSYSSTASNDADAWWAQAGWSGGIRNSSRISRNDFRDVNFIKKTIGEKAGRGSPQYTVWNFDGRYFRGAFSVYGNESLFRLMAEAMMVWEDFHKKRAIFVQKKGSADLLLVWSDGIFHSPPIPFEHESFNDNPGNDQSFVRNLPKHLDEIKQENSAEEPAKSPSEQKWFRISFRSNVATNHLSVCAQTCFNSYGIGFVFPDVMVLEKFFDTLIEDDIVSTKYHDDIRWAISISEDHRNVYFLFKDARDAQDFSATTNK